MNEYILESKIIEGRLYLHVKLNDRLAGYMLFDNGASRCVVFKKNHETLGLKETGTSSVSLFSGQANIPTVDSIKIELGQLISKIPSAYIIEDNNYEECNNIIGTIGANFINQFNWSIDLKNNKVYCKNEPYKETKVVFQTYPSIEGGSIALKGQCSNDNIYFFLDFGYDGELLIPSKYIPEMTLFNKQKLGYSFKGNLGGPLANNGAENISVVKIDNLTFGNVSIYEANATIGNFNYFNIGTQFLKHFKIYLNSTENEIGFLPLENKKLIMPPQFDYGLDFAYDKVNGSFFVSRVFNNHILSGKFYIGQVVHSINNKTPKDFENECAVNNYILKCRTKKSFQIVVQNDKYTLTRDKIPLIKL